MNNLLSKGHYIFNKQIGQPEYVNMKPTLTKKDRTGLERSDMLLEIAS